MSDESESTNKRLETLEREVADLKKQLDALRRATVGSKLDLKRAVPRGSGVRDE